MTAPVILPLGLALNAGQSSLLLEALGERPFRSVHALIGRLDAWAGAAFPADAGPLHPPAMAFALTLPELALALDALGDLPHRRVYRLVASLQGQLDQLARLQHAGAVHG